MAMLRLPRTIVWFAAPDLVGTQIGGLADELIGQVGYYITSVPRLTFGVQIEDGSRQPGRVRWRPVVGEHPLPVYVAAMGLDAHGGG